MKPGKTQLNKVMTRHQRRRFYCMLSVAVALITLFATVWFNTKNVAHNFQGASHSLDFLLFAIVTYIVWHQIMMDSVLWLIARGMKRPKHTKPAPGLKVAFITTFVPGSEPLMLLDNILPAMKRADYDHDTWLLDEGNDPNAKELCKKYGVNYFTRKEIKKYNQDSGQPFAVKTKGGNHNAWYDAHGHGYDIVAQIDTDFVPRKNFLMRTLGYFNDPDVAFVGTPQIYGNDKESGVARGAAEQGFTFYGPILRGLSGRNSTMLLGANHVIRVSALKEIGYYRAHLTEDLLTGMTLHSRKYKSLYVAESLAVGEGPSNWQDYFNQQMRWAHGCFDILFHHTPKLVSKMTLRQRAYYLVLQQHYLSGVAMAVGVFLLTLYFAFGIQISVVPAGPFLVTYIPLMLVNLGISTWLQRFNIRPEKEKGLLPYGKAVSIAAQPIYMLAFFGALFGRKLSFKVTPKMRDLTTSRTPAKLFLPHFVLGTITLADLIVGLDTGRESPILIFWAATNTLLMYGVTFVALSGAIADLMASFRTRLSMIRLDY